MSDKSIDQGMALLIGPWDKAEFAIALESLTARASLVAAPDCEAANEMLDRNEVVPEFILLAQRLAGTLQQNQIDELRRAAPLSRIVIIAGTWCEGELRTGQPLAGVMRLYWYELGTWCQTALNFRCFTLGLDSPLSPRRVGAPTGIALSAPVAIHTPKFASFTAISGALRLYEIECIWCRQTSELPSQLSAGIWDGGQLDVRECERLQEFASAVQRRSGSLVVLVDFPRKEHYARLSELGCNSIFGKPYINEELVAAVARPIDAGNAIPGLENSPIL